MKIYRLFIVFAFLIFLAAEVFLFDFTVEDSFSTYRYVQSLAFSDNVLFTLYNGSPHASNPVWTSLLMPFVWLNVPLIVVAKSMGIISTLILSLFFYLLAKRYITKNTWQLASMLTLYLLTNMSILFYSVSGRDTLLFAALIMVFLWLIEEKHWVLADIILCLIFITRPEGMFLILPYSIALFRDKRVSKITFAILIPVLLFGGFLLYKWNFVENLFPEGLTTIILGNAGPLNLLINNTMTFIPEISFWSLTILGLGSMAVFALTGIVKTWNKNLPLLFTVLILFFQIWFRGSESLAFNQTFVPVLAPVLLFAAVGLDGLFKQIEVAKTRKWIFLATVLVFLGMNVTYTSFCTYHLYNKDLFKPEMTSTIHREIGTFFKEYANSWDVVVTTDAGAVNYYSGLKTVDPNELMQRDSQDRKPKNFTQRDARDVFKSDPRFILVSVDEANSSDMMDESSKSIYNEIVKYGSYSLLKEFDHPSKKKWLLYEQALMVATK